MKAKKHSLGCEHRHNKGVKGAALRPALPVAHDRRSVLPVFLSLHALLMLLVLTVPFAASVEGKPAAVVSPEMVGSAEPLPYAEALLFARKEWKNRFPAEALSMSELPPGRRMLFARVQGIPVYYYRFSVELPRLYRAEDESIQKEELPARTAEVWFRYQPQLKQGDFAFVRENLLPGTDRRWIE